MGERSATAEIADLAGQPAAVLEQAAILLVEGFVAPGGWKTLTSAREEVVRVIAEGFARGMLRGELLLGWIGGLPQYEGHVWELHPMVVRKEHRRRGIGRALVEAFEREVQRRGGLTMTLGTDDDAGMTSLSEVDLYSDTPRHIAELRDLGRGHPFLFYRKLGYVVTGVMPDANGLGRPDIYMSKPVRR
ncbi:MAG TPA: GNAT family N-acetyltransferase [Gemmatimonadaceae bacterium]|nr:GNAT family N-acetyltransferase [Gemmatimonadaceae bacterium]